MTKVDFYILATAAADQRAAFACRLANKAFRQGLNIYLHTGGEQQGREIDSLLWEFRPQSFLPHGVLGEPASDRIAIGWGDDPGEHHDLMINLDLSVPAFVGRFQRVAEIVSKDIPAIRQPLLQSWKWYEDRGYELNRTPVST